MACVHGPETIEEESWELPVKAGRYQGTDGCGDGRDDGTV
jgi:hypothetical protein